MKSSGYERFKAVAERCNSVTNGVCVVLLTIQVITILIMVFGRYIFNSSPAWTEQCALFCMIWFSMLSISLGVGYDTHVKVDLIDSWVSPKHLLWIKCFANILVVAFGVVLVCYGIPLSRMTWKTKLSSLRLPTGLQYASAIVGGVFIILNGVFAFMRLLHDAKEGGQA